MPTTDIPASAKAQSDYVTHMLESPTHVVYLRQLA